MAKINIITKKTHAYLLDDGTVVRAINEAHIKEYQKDGVQVYSCPATKTVDGIKVETNNHYVPVDKFVKRSSARTSLKEKLASIVSGRDLSTMKASELLELLG